MARLSPEATDQGEVILAKVRQHYRLGQVLLVVGLVVAVACSGLGFFLSGSTGLGAGFLIYVTGTAGFALLLAGAVLFVESRAFLRRNQGVV
jgi:hypothetical protein